MDKSLTQIHSAPDEGTNTRRVFTGLEKTQKFCSNQVETAKYSLITWLPKSIFLQFARVNNIYFLILTILSFFPFSPYNPWGYASYFVFILLFTSIKDGIEDIARHKQDKKVNKSLYLKFGSKLKDFKKIECQHVKVGTFIKVLENQSFPADMVFILSSESQVAYVNTMNLDGETNLKEKNSVNLVNSEDQLSKVNAVFDIEQPGKELHSWSGLMSVSGTTEGINIKNLLLRGCTLKNTDWVIGLVVYTGNECKIVMNGENRISKISSVQKKINKIVFTVIGFLVIVCTCYAIAGQSWINNNPEIEAYIELENTNDAVSGVYIYFTYWIMFSALIPLSLYLFIEIQRLILCSFIPKDLKMYYEPTDTTAIWRTSDVIEELGRVEFIFSDKTGTLTSNQMKLEKFFIKNSIFSTKTDSDTISQIAASRENPFFTHFQEFFYNLVLCNSVFPTHHNGNIEYHSVSPDETALVDFASKFNTKILLKEKNEVKIGINDREEPWKIKAEIPFTSDRKRMTVVAQGPSGELKLYIKGADEVVFPLLQEADLREVQEAVDKFAKEGLRTLVLATRTLDKSWFKEWAKQWKTVKSDEDKQEVYNKLVLDIEQGLEFCAITAIEDKLQDGVPETIDLLLRTNIKIWVITGDKEETALEISKSCNLITSESKLISLFNCDTKKLETKLKKVLKTNGLENIDIKNLSKYSLSGNYSLALNGVTLSYIKSDPLLEDLFFIVAFLSKSVVCCRMSPSQKSEIVKIVKKRGEWVTLAIGDGANDVSMLKEASVGVGIFGKEGNQAILASDFALPQFSHLQPLLLIHGRYAYSRIGHFVLYYFYTDYMLQVCEAWLAFYTGFSGQIYYLDWIPSTYNIFVMSLPTMASFALDQDISPSMCLKYPGLYSAGQKGSFFNIKEFWTWIFWTIVGGTIIFWVSMGSFRNGTGSDGLDASLFWCSSVSYITLVSAVNWKLLFITRSWNYYYG